MGVKRSNVSDDNAVLSAFPSFYITKQASTSMAGYLSMFDNFCGYSFQIGKYGFKKAP